MLKDRMVCSFVANIRPKFPRCAEIDGRVTGRSLCGILQRLLERLGILWGDVSTRHYRSYSPVGHSTPLDNVKSVKVKTSCLIAEHCLC